MPDHLSNCNCFTAKITYHDICKQNHERIHQNQESLIDHTVQGDNNGNCCQSAQRAVELIKNSLWAKDCRLKKKSRIKRRSYLQIISADLRFRVIYPRITYPEEQGDRTHSSFSEYSQLMIGLISLIWFDKPANS